jgi:tetratricopeptide (TPR) repeat protein
LLRAIKAFDEAIALDSSFALAYAGKASAYRTLGALYQSAEEMYPLARDAVEEALAIDESLAEAYSELGRIRFTFEYDLPGARSAFERAVSLKEHDGEIRRAYGHALIPVDLEAALRQFETARRLDPESVLVANCYGHTLDWAGNADDAIAEFDRATQIDPANPVTRVYRAHSLMRQGLFDEAIHEIELTEEMLTYFFPYMAGDLGCAYALAGREREAREQLPVLEERARQGEYVPHLAFAKIYAGLGQVNDAVDALERAFEAREYIIFIGDWPHFQKVREHPRFIGLLRRMGVQRWATSTP